MPEISRFLGIVIGMYYRDHNPPHFHAYHGEEEDWERARSRQRLKPIDPLE